MKNQQNRNDIHDFAITRFVIAGGTPESHEQRKSFELIRNSSLDLTIITFDELIIRLREIQKVLTPTNDKNVMISPETDIPF